MTDLRLLPVESGDLRQYKADMQEAFQLGAQEGGYFSQEQDHSEESASEDMLILPEGDIDRSLGTKGAIAYKAVLNGEIVGGAIVVLDQEAGHGHLDFLYVKHGVQSRGIGKFMWFEIEKLHPEIKVWETCTPYFEKRNLHFYVNVCRFHVVDYWNSRHKDPNSPFDEPDGEEHGDFGMFGFRKEV